MVYELELCPPALCLGISQITLALVIKTPKLGKLTTLLVEELIQKMENHTEAMPGLVIFQMSRKAAKCSLC
jgi:hypothetical protein